MHIDVVPNRGFPRAVLLRESRREGGRGVKRTRPTSPIGPPEKVELLRQGLNHEPLISPEECFEIVRSLSHGHAEPVFGGIRRLRVDRLMAAKQIRRTWSSA